MIFLCYFRYNNTSVKEGKMLELEYYVIARLCRINPLATVGA